METFKLFDIKNKGYLTVSDFKDTVRAITGEGLASSTVEEIYLVFRRYDKDRDDRISYAEFC